MALLGKESLYMNFVKETGTRTGRKGNTRDSIMCIQSELEGVVVIIHEGRGIYPAHRLR